MSTRVSNSIKRVIGILAILFTVFCMIYGLATGNTGIAILGILIVRFFAPLLQVDDLE